MNLELIQFGFSYPEHNDGILDSGSEAVTCAFNRRGTLLAVGCNDGRIAIWDFMTRGIARLCSSHIHPITSLSWNRSGQKLLSSATDWNVILWDVATGEIDLQIRFPSPVMKVQFNPRNSAMFIACPMKHSPVVLVQKDDQYSHTVLPTDGEPEVNMCAAFERQGKHIIAGSSKGKVFIIEASTMKVLMSFRILTGANSIVAVKSIECARRGSSFVINGSDKVLRVYSLDDLLAKSAHRGNSDDDVEALQRLQDLVNRTQWKKCTFSGDGEYICAGSHRQHSLYIWDKATGNLVKMLTGQKGENLLDLTWHPVQPIILSISNGVVNIWSHSPIELWSAYAPNFKELDENEEYEERESEFDIEDEDKSVNEEDTSKALDDMEVDITNIPPIPAFCSSEEDSDEPLDWLPIAPEVEDPEESGWGQLEPSLNAFVGVDSESGPANGSPGQENDDSSQVTKPGKHFKIIDINLPVAMVADDGKSKEKVKPAKDGRGKRGKPGLNLDSEPNEDVLAKSL